ncbi:hypothetical protein C8A03DRAFT_36184 [Achaetomium macrosporum]|uniref:Uncharacterized protein n=1 Tax=Achaetomium macrosporum TaxID=79813 RepID=A0AAN7C708_9PEZI|nr:hypothetical protein C8A03DRAFT_36184 [Achaetomium macrosporum]
MASNANTEDTRDALNSPEPRRRPLRSPKPSAKVRETLIFLENKAKPTKNTSSAATRPDSAPTLDGRTSVAQRLLAEASNTRQKLTQAPEVCIGVTRWWRRTQFGKLPVSGGKL